MKLGEPCENYTPPPHPKGITLESMRVILEPLNESRHGQHLYEANSLDTEGRNWAYLKIGPFDNYRAYADWIKSIENIDDQIYLAIIRKSDNKAVGVASYMRINQIDGSIEVGSINYSPLLQNTTEATEAMYLMMKWVFENGYRRYEWKCNALNVKSRRAAQRLGFSYEGVSRQMVICKERNRDTAWFAAIDKEWPDLKKCYEAYLSPDNFDLRDMPITSLTSRTKSLLYKKDNMDLS